MKPFDDRCILAKIKYDDSEASVVEAGVLFGRKSATQRELRKYRRGYRKGFERAISEILRKADPLLDKNSQEILGRIIDPLREYVDTDLTSWIGPEQEGEKPPLIEMDDDQEGEEPPGIPEV